MSDIDWLIFDKLIELDPNDVVLKNISENRSLVIKLDVIYGTNKIPHISIYYTKDDVDDSEYFCSTGSNMEFRKGLKVINITFVDIEHIESVLLPIYRNSKIEHIIGMCGKDI